MAMYMCERAVPHAPLGTFGGRALAPCPLDPPMRVNVINRVEISFHTMRRLGLGRLMLDANIIGVC